MAKKNQDTISTSLPDLSTYIVKSCYHCGEQIAAKPVVFSDKNFCCTGCSTVYQLLNKHGLCHYYTYTEKPGINQSSRVREGKFIFLDDEEIKKALLVFENGRQAQVIFYLPQMHCSSCLWLLENLHNFNTGIISSRVDFGKKEVTILFEQDQVSLRKVAEILTSIGYEPHLSLNDIGKPRNRYYNKKRIYQIGVAGFCFSNIMMLSFPEYFGLTGIQEIFDLQQIFQFLIMVLSLPVLFYSASDFFVSGWKGLKNGMLNIDAPIALAIGITFTRSVLEITSGTGAGYLDSMSGIVFFMLAGRILQDRTQQSLSFERDYTSYFPIAVNKLTDGREIPVSLPNLKSGDSIVIHSNEIIPADGILVKGQAIIDYSFVTGESKAIEKRISEIVYAGGKQTGGKIELLLVKEVSQSYLTSLWNKESMRRETNTDSSFVHTWSKYFTIALFSIAVLTATWWYLNDVTKIWPAVTAVLIVACPCALLLSNSFTNGHIISFFDRNKFYLRNASVLERLCKVEHIVFDKTGTLTNSDQYAVSAYGDELTSSDKNMLASLAQQSLHPLSRTISTYLKSDTAIKLESFKETAGKGCEAWICEQHIVMGSTDYVFGKHEPNLNGSIIAFRIDKTAQGFFVIKNNYRMGIKKMLNVLRQKFIISIISGDNNEEQENLSKMAGTKATLLFNQSPEDKLAFIESLQKNGEQVMMVGDGLNDAGALKQSHVGIAITNNINNFSPACDAIMEASQLPALSKYIRMAKAGKMIITASFILSVCYNIIGLSFAVQGSLSPMLAAILMPASSISIVLFTWLAVQLIANRLLGGSNTN